MAEVRLTDDGRLVNAETGEEFGRNENGRIVIDSDESDGIPLEETGFGAPEETEEEYYEAMVKQGEATGRSEYDGSSSIAEESSSSSSAAEGGTKEEAGSRNSVDAQAPVNSRKSHMDSGPTSFDVKRTKYEVTPETYFIVRFGLTTRDEGGYYAINVNSARDNPDAEEHWVKFRMWTYDEELKWKSECMEFNSQSKVQYINLEKLNEKKIRMLMLDWSFGEKEDRLKLLHCDGKLSDESYSIFCGLFPVIANSIVDLMNSVLENG